MRHPSNLKPPFVMYVAAPRGSGKTHLLVNLMIQPKFYRNMFNKVYIFCPTYYKDSKYAHLNLPEHQVFTEYSNETLEDIIEHCNPKHQTLVIFDDCMAETDFKNNNNDNPLNKLAVRGRHDGISIIVITQKTTGTSTIVRSQSDGLIIFNCRSQAEIKAIYEDNCIGGLSFNDFKDLLIKYTKEQYSFLYFNYQNNKAYDRNFQEILL